jgi:hypothetical protein
LDGGIGAVVGGFEWAMWTVFRVRQDGSGFGECATSTPLDESVALDQAVSPALAQAVAELVQAVGLLREVEDRSI